MGRTDFVEQLMMALHQVSKVTHRNTMNNWYTEMEVAFHKSNWLSLSDVIVLSCDCRRPLISQIKNRLQLWQAIYKSVYVVYMLQLSPIHIASYNHATGYITFYIRLKLFLTTYVLVSRQWQPPMVRRRDDDCPLQSDVLNWLTSPINAILIINGIIDDIISGWSYKSGFCKWRSRSSKSSCPTLPATEIWQPSSTKANLRPSSSKAAQLSWNRR